MEKKGFFGTNQIALIGAAFIWIVAFILYQIYHEVGVNYWTGFAFGLLGMAVAEAGVLFAARTNRSTLETSGIYAYYSLIYIAVVIALNIFFASTDDYRYITLLVTANIIILIVYILLTYNANKYIKDVSDKTERAAAKTQNAADISKELAVLISISQNSEIKQELIKLKEKVDYSNNVSQNISQKTEDVFLQKLRNIHDAISKGIEPDIIKSGIRDAEETWNIRNSSMQ